MLVITDKKRAGITDDALPTTAEVQKAGAETRTYGEWSVTRDYREPGLKGIFHRLTGRISAFFDRLIHGKRVLTPAGICFLNYCRSIVDGTLRPEQHVAAYEEQLSMLTGMFKTDTGEQAPSVPREVLAETVIYFMSDMETEA